MKGKKHLDEKNKRLRDVPNSFINKMKGIQKKQAIILSSIMKGMELKGESISPIKANFMLIEKIKDELRKDLLEGDYKDAVKIFAVEFNEQKKVNEKYYSTISSDFTGEAAEEAVKRIQRLTVENLINDTIKTDFLNPLDETLTNAVASGAGFMETVESINDFIEGKGDRIGAIHQWTKQIAHDSFANSDRAFGNAIADELELEFYLYAGDEIQTTRCFCLERYGNYYHYKEIERWGRGEDVGKCGFPWQGMNRETNESTIFNYAGGYNCLHSIVGVSVFDVPEDVVRRNVENGNYQPTQFEIEEFGL